MASLTLRIPDYLERQLSTESAERGVSKSDVARDAIVRHLRLQAIRRLREQVRPKLESQGVYTEADVFDHLGDKRNRPAEPSYGEGGGRGRMAG